MDADLVIVGGGYTGSGRRSTRRIATRSPASSSLEASTVGWASSGRNGGFGDASLTHGQENGDRRWPDEMRQLDRLGMQNLDAIDDIAAIRHGRRLRAHRHPDASRPSRTSWSGSRARASRTTSTSTRKRCRPRSRPRPSSAGVGQALDGAGAPRPPRRRAGPSRPRAGVVIFERSPVRLLDDDGDAVMVRTDHGHVRATRVALATNVFPSLLKRNRLMTVPVYDYVLMTEPLTAPAVRRDRLAQPPGHRRYRQPVPLLPAARPTTASCSAATTRSTTRVAACAPVREPPRDVPQACEPLLHDLPATRGHAVQPSLGRRNRHLHPVLRVLRHRPRRQRRLRRRFHRTRRRRHAVRRRRHARPARRRDAPSAPNCGWCARARCRSRPSRRHPSAST